MNRTNRESRLKINTVLMVIDVCSLSHPIMARSFPSASDGSRVSENEQTIAITEMSRV